MSRLHGVAIGLTLSCVALLGGPTVRDAQARGGNFRGPGGAVSPNRREPSDPVPPAPPAPSTRAPAAQPTARTPPTAPPTAPPPGSRPPPVAVIRGTLDFAAWPFWYHTSREVFERRPAAALAFARRWELRTSTILPALLTASGWKAPLTEHIAETALIALGRAATEEAHINRLLEAFGHQGSLMLREAAAIGLGLLRRTDPSMQFPAARLDSIRHQLYLTLKDEAQQAPLRAYAATSIGLLGDQPTTGKAMAQATTGRLFKVLVQKHHHPDVPIAVLHAVSLQPPATWSAYHRALVRKILRENTLPGGRRAPNIEAHAAIALGRMGAAEDVPLLATMLGEEHLPRRNLRRSVAIALGTLAERLDEAARTKITVVLLAALGLERDPMTRNLLTMGLARTAAADGRAAGKPTALLTDLGVVLRADLQDSASRTSAYAALGLGLMGRALAAKRTAASARWIDASALALRTALADATRSGRLRGAAAMGLGLLGAPGDSATLLSIVTNRAAHPELRPAAARALGLIGAGDPTTLHALEAAVVERRSERLRQDAMAALGMLDARASVVTVLNELENARDVGTKGAAALALGNLPYRAPVEALVTLMNDKTKRLSVRMAACAALGLMADPEPRPSLSRFTSHLNWRTSSNLFRMLFDQL